MKKILFILITIFCVFIIYYVNLDKKIFILSIGDNLTLGIDDSNYQKDINNCLGKRLKNNVIFGNDGDYRIIDLLNDINNNKRFIYKNKEYLLDNVLIKADIIFISIGMNDLNYNNNNNYDYLDEVIRDLDTLLKLIRKYSKEDIYIFNYYNLNSNELTIYINKRLNNLVKKYDINILDISNINSIELNKDDYDIIEKKMIESLKEFY